MAGAASRGSEVSAPRTGRPRNLEPEAEIRRILDATVEVLRRHQYSASSIRDILTEAGLGTRAFYRHFGSKDDLLWAVYRREADSFARRLTAAATAAGDPTAAVAACIEEYLAVFYHRRWAERASALQFAQVGRDDGHDGDRDHAAAATCLPLAEAIRAGVGAGDFHSADPDLDARTIRALTFAVAQAPDPLRPRRLADARAHCLRFADGALRVRSDGAVSARRA